MRVTRGYLRMAGLASSLAKARASGLAFSSSTYFFWNAAQWSGSWPKAFRNAVDGARNFAHTS